MHGAGKVSNVSGGDSGDADTSVAGEVNVIVVAETVDLLGGQSGETKHSDLIGDVLPVARRSLALEGVNEGGTHRNDAARHEFDLVVPFFFAKRRRRSEKERGAGKRERERERNKPLGSKNIILEDFGHNVGSIDGRVGIHGTDEDLELTLDATGLLGVVANDRKRSNTLSVETKVLGKRLGDDKDVAVVGKLTDGKSVTLSVSRGESLVGIVKEGKVFLFLHERRDLGPLLGRGVDSGGVVSANVKKDDRSLRSVLFF